MNTINLDKHIWEGWVVDDFIEELEPIIEQIMNNRSWIAPFINRKDLAKWCTDNQPYYKKVIPEVVEYFCVIYNIN